MFFSLFVTSFISATLWPMASEALFVVAFQQNPDALLKLVIVASAGNSLGAILMYELGRLSHNWVQQRFIDQHERVLRVEKYFQRYGSPLLFFAWLPIVGDLIPIVAGSINIKRGPAWVWLILGKSCRYSLLAWGAAAVVG